MKNFKVINTIDDSVETLNTMKEVNKYIETEIRWFNSPNENKNNSGYSKHDFIITELN